MRCMRGRSCRLSIDVFQNRSKGPTLRRMYLGGNRSRMNATAFQSGHSSYLCPSITVRELLLVREHTLKVDTHRKPLACILASVPPRSLHKFDMHVRMEVRGHRSQLLRSAGTSTNESRVPCQPKKHCLIPIADSIWVKLSHASDLDAKGSRTQLRML